MTVNQTYKKYKDQFFFKFTIGILMVAIIIGVASQGFDFGQWLRFNK
ncbi:MAG: hypothetical protein JWN56_432 [Sphingobacteriales bacterium]|nr:hypothetical protein [Sphingobacteriales bacterium]